MDDLTARLLAGSNLEEEEVRQAADALLQPQIADEKKAAFLKALAQKGETAGEITAFVQAFLRHAVAPGISPADAEGPSLDVCGTGGDQLGLFNISTAAMFVLAGGGVNLIKHGNRGNSKSGGADVLEALGVPINLPSDQLREGFLRHRAAFLFAPAYHPSFAVIAPVRRQLAGEGMRTIFNILGPLLNPVCPEYQLVGVMREELTPVFARILQNLGRRSVWAVHGTGDGKLGMDELSTLGASSVTKLKEGEISHFQVNPEETGLKRGELEQLRGGNASENALLIEAILSGEVTDGRLDIVLLNAAAGFVITGLAGDLKEGVATARESIESGAATRVLNGLRSFAKP